MNPNYHEILKRYNTELQNYANRLAPQFNKYMEHQRRPFNKYLKGIFDFYLFCSYLTDNGLFPVDEKYKPLKILYAKGTLSLFGIYSCLYNGVVTEANISVRSLFETYLYTKLILESDTDNRLRLYDDYIYVARWNDYKENKKLYENGTIDKGTYEYTYNSERINTVVNDYNKVKHNYHPSRPYSWAWKIYKDENNNNNPSIKFISEKLHEEIDYVKVYSPLSVSVHNNPAMINLLSTKDSISLAPKYTESIFHAGSLAVDYTAKITELLIDYFDYGNVNELKIYIREFVLAILDEYETK